MMWLILKENPLSADRQDPLPERLDTSRNRQSSSSNLARKHCSSQRNTPYPPKLRSGVEACSTSRSGAHVNSTWTC